MYVYKNQKVRIMTKQSNTMSFFFDYENAVYQTIGKHVKIKCDIQRREKK
jgi:hypothetical protein